MRVGDKYICIKTKTYNNHILHINTEYTIKEIFYKEIFYIEKMVRVISNKNLVNINDIDYNFTWAFKLEYHKLYSKFDYHFITKKEYRKLKIKNIETKR